MSHTIKNKFNRRNRWLVFCLAIFLTGVMASSSWALEVSSKEEAIKLAFPGAEKIVKKRIFLKDAQRAAIAKICKRAMLNKRVNFYVGYKGGQPMGYATLETVTNRTWPISYIVVMNSDGTIQDVEVLNYQGARNWGVQAESWLKQFFGKNADSDFSAPTGITGATVSVRTINKGVHCAVASYKVLFQGGKK